MVWTEFGANNGGGQKEKVNRHARPAAMRIRFVDLTIYLLFTVDRTKAGTVVFFFFLSGGICYRFMWKWMPDASLFLSRLCIYGFQRKQICFIAIAPKT